VEVILKATPAGSVGQFGEVKVNPLSVPASSGSASNVRESMKCPPWQRFKLSRPMNQSGEGTNFVKRETLVCRPSRKILAEVLPEPLGIGAAVKLSSRELFPLLLSSPVLSAVSTNSFTPELTASPREKRLKSPVWENPRVFDHCAGGRH